MSWGEFKAANPRWKQSTLIKNQQEEEEGERQGPYQGGGTVNDIAVPQDCVGVYS
jgi:hypothetical protein